MSSGSIVHEECQAIHTWGTRVDISVKWENRISYSTVRMRGGGKKIDSSARGSGADVRRITTKDELRQ